MRGDVGVPVEERWLNCSRKKPLYLVTQGEANTAIVLAVVEWRPKMIPAATLPGAPRFTHRFTICLLRLSGVKAAEGMRE